MSTIRCVYPDGAPDFPATDQHPDAARYLVGGVYVDAIGGAPTLQEVQAFLNPSADDRGAAAIDAEDRLRFEIAFDMENRMRAQEGLGAVTRAQYRTALINRWKALNR